MSRNNLYTDGFNAGKHHTYTNVLAHLNNGLGVLRDHLAALRSGWDENYRDVVEKGLVEDEQEERLGCKIDQLQDLIGEVTEQMQEDCSLPDFDNQHTFEVVTYKLFSIVREHGLVPYKAYMDRGLVQDWFRRAVPTSLFTEQLSEHFTYQGCDVRSASYEGICYGVVTGLDQNDERLYTFRYNLDGSITGDLIHGRPVRS